MKTMNNAAWLGIASVLLFVSNVAIAKEPPRNVSAKRHPNIAAAQRFIQQAWERTVAAQKANEWDMQGHAQRAKELLERADQELKLAATTAN